MATEEGIVFKMGAPGAGTAWVKTTRSSACETCSSKGACHGEGGGKEMEMEVEAFNTADARVGDRIRSVPPTVHSRAAASPRPLRCETRPVPKHRFAPAQRLLYLFPIGGGLSHQAMRRASGRPT